MRPRLIPATALVMFAIIIVAGCTKKTTKIETPVQEKSTSVYKEPVSDPVHFDAVDMDAEMRELLVPVYFDYDKYNLRPDALAKLERIAPFLEKNASVRIVMEGHADERGTDEYNISLAENRARSTKAYLVNFGLSRDRFEMVSYGKSRPAHPSCADEDCHQLNRRVEWKVLSR